MAKDLRTFIIANPQAGAGMVKKEWEVIDRLIKNTLSEYDVAFTSGPGHATLLAREAIKAGWEQVVSVGGDGTLNEVVNGFFEAPEGDKLYTLDDGWVVRKEARPELLNPDAVLGLIPIGTGGDFRRTLGIMGGWRQAVERLGGKETRQIDVGQLGFVNHEGRLDSRIFINIASAGLSGLVDKLANKTWKGFGGKASFAIASVRAMALWKNVDTVMRIDEVEEIDQRLMNCVLANGQYFGGGMRVAPGAQLDDGQLQLVVVGDVGRLASLPKMTKLYSGNHLDLDGIWHRHVRSLAVKPKQPTIKCLLDVDGEQPGTLPATWHVLPQAIKVKI